MPNAQYQHMLRAPAADELASPFTMASAPLAYSVLRVAVSG